jgi:hypothetical protein
MQQITVTFTASHQYKATIWATEKEIELLQREPKTINREVKDQQEIFIDLIVDKENVTTNKILHIESVTPVTEPQSLQSKHHFNDY